MDVHFNSNKIKYTILDQLVNPITRAQNIQKVNLFINLDDIFHRLHRPLINSEFQVCGENASKQMISNVLNIIAHYRQWAIRQGWNVSVYAIYTSVVTGGFKNSLYVKDYRKKYSVINDDRSVGYFFINQAIKQSADLFRVISQYIENVYVIDSRFIEPSLLPLYLSEAVNPADWNFLITKDAYDLQYAYRDRWTILYPAGDNSKIIRKTDLWNHISEKEHIDLSKYRLDYDLSLFPLTVSVVGDKYRNIPRIKRVGWKTLFSILDKISEYSGDKTATTIRLLLMDELKTRHTTTEDLNNNLAVTDIEAQVQRIGEIDKSSIAAQLINIPDYENLVNLNKIYFSKYPINLSFLTSASSGQQRKNPFGFRK